MFRLMFFEIAWLVKAIFAGCHRLCVQRNPGCLRAGLSSWGAGRPMRLDLRCLQSLVEHGNSAFREAHRGFGHIHCFESNFPCHLADFCLSVFFRVSIVVQELACWWRWLRCPLFFLLMSTGHCFPRKISLGSFGCQCSSYCRALLCTNGLPNCRLDRHAQIAVEKYRTSPSQDETYIENKGGPDFVCKPCSILEGRLLGKVFHLFIHTHGYIIYIYTHTHTLVILLCCLASSIASFFALCSGHHCFGFCLLFAFPACCALQEPCGVSKGHLIWLIIRSSWQPRYSPWPPADRKVERCKTGWWNSNTIWY